MPFDQGSLLGLRIETKAKILGGQDCCVGCMLNVGIQSNLVLFLNFYVGILKWKLISLIRALKSMWDENVNQIQLMNI